MNRINANKKRTLRQLLNNARADANQPEFRSIRGYNKLFETTTNETYNLMDNLLGVVVREVRQNQNNMMNVIELYYATRGTTRHLLYIVDGNVMVDRTIDIPDFNTLDELIFWFEQGEKWLWRDNTDTDVFDDNAYDGKIYSYAQNTNITPRRIIQSYLDGKSHCVFTPIREWVDENLQRELSETATKNYRAFYKKLDKLEIQYSEGVPEENLNEVCKILNVKININNLFSKTIMKYGEELKRPQKVFQYTNTRVNHIDIGMLTTSNKPEMVTKDFILNKIDEYDANNTFYYYTKGMGHISSVYTMNEAYSVSSEYHDAISALQKEYGMDTMKIDDITQPELSDFIKRGTHFNTSIAFENFMDNTSNGICNLKNIDQNKAYYNFKQCKYYEGFLGKVTDFRKTDKIVGIGLYLIKDLNPYNCFLKDRQKFVALNERMNMYSSNNVYTSVELKYLKSMGWSYKIIAGCWGNGSFDFDFGEDMLDKANKKPFVDEYGNLKMKGSSFYAMATGIWTSHNLYNTKYIRGTEETYQVLREQTDHDILKFHDTEEISIRIRKEHNYTLSHISSFILAYQRLSLIEQLMEMDITKLQSVYVDGIYYIDHEFKTLDTFKEGDCESYSSMNIKRKDFITEVYKTKPKFDLHPYREHHKTELWTGAGGCGKTHQNLIDFGFVNLLFCAPSHKLCASKANEFGCNVTTTQSLFVNNPMCKSHYANVLLIDEVSMMTNEEKKFILKKYNTQKIIMCGDIGYQIPAWKGTPFVEDGFEYYKHLTENHRVKEGDPLLDLLNEVRDTIKNKSGKKFSLPIVDMSYIKEHYNRDDMILAFSNKTSNNYTATFSSIKKWYIENSKVHHHGEIFAQDEKPEGEKVIIKHGYTCASIQGETAKHNIYIDIECMNNINVLYTALSRAKKLSQIKIVTNDF
jgi:hypothetical protein